MSSSNDLSVGGNMEDTMLHDPQQVDVPLDLEVTEGSLLNSNDWNWASPGGFSDDLSTDFFGNVPGGHSTLSFDSPSAPQEASLPIRTAVQQQPVNPSPSVSNAENFPVASPTEYVANCSAGYASADHVSHSGLHHSPPAHHPVPSASSLSPNEPHIAVQNALPPLGTLTSMSISSPRTLMGAGNFGHAVSGDGAVIPVLDGSHVPQQQSFTSTSAAAEPLPCEDIADNMESEEEEQDESEDQQDSEDLGNLRTQKRTPKPVTLVNGRPHFAPSMSCLLDPLASGANTQTEFSGVEEAHAYLRSRSVVAPDPTLPHSDSQKKAIVCAMLNLMKNTEYALDNDKVVAPFENKKWSDKRIEAACWQVLEIAMDCHINGPLLTTYNNTRPRHNFPTFAERMAQILEAIGMHKTICKHIMDPPYIYFMVDDPLSAQKRVKSNKALNQRKGAYMRAGQALLEPRTPRHRRKPSPKSAKRSAKTLRKSSSRKTTPEKTASPAETGPQSITPSTVNTTVVGQNPHHSQQSQQSATPGNVIYPVHPPQAMNAQAGQQSYGLTHASGMAATLASSGPMVSASALPAEPTMPFFQQHMNTSQGFPTAFGSDPFKGTMPGPLRRMTLPSANNFTPYIPEPAAQFDAHGTPSNVHQFSGAMFDQNMMYHPSANVAHPMMGAPITPGSNGRKRGSLGSYQYHDGSPGKRRC